MVRTLNDKMKGKDFMLNNTIELIGVTESKLDEDLTSSRDKSEIDEAMTPEVQVYFGTDENLAELCDDAVLLRACGCELHFNEASFELFECKDHLAVTMLLS